MGLHELFFFIPGAVAMWTDQKFSLTEASISFARHALEGQETSHRQLNAAPTDEHGWFQSFVNVIGIILLFWLLRVEDAPVLSVVINSHSGKGIGMGLWYSCLYSILATLAGILAWFLAQVAHQCVESVFVHPNSAMDATRVSALICGGVLLVFGLKKILIDNVYNLDEMLGELRSSSMTSNRTKPSSMESTPRIPPPIRREYKIGTGSIRVPNASQVSLGSVSPLSFEDRNEEEWVVHESVAHVVPAGVLADVPILPPADSLEAGSANAHEGSRVSFMVGLPGIILLLAIDDAILFGCMIQGTEISLVDVIVGLLIASMSASLSCIAFRSVEDWPHRKTRRVMKGILIVCCGLFVLLAGSLGVRSGLLSAFGIAWHMTRS
mmetsp:Transcript_30040/g.56157  ORF Transcript_30040/g.56157 Transcript_30040/m.56157 type:complete len:381 (-) Transcript_30040:243-1385(-)